MINEENYCFHELFKRFIRVPKFKTDFREEWRRQYETFHI